MSSAANEEKTEKIDEKGKSIKTSPKYAFEEVLIEKLLKFSLEHDPDTKWTTCYTPDKSLSIEHAYLKDENNQNASIGTIRGTTKVDDITPEEYFEFCNCLDKGTVHPNPFWVCTVSVSASSLLLAVEICAPVHSPSQKKSCIPYIVSSSRVAPFFLVFSYAHCSLHMHRN